MLIAVIITITR